MLFEGNNRIETLFDKWEINLRRNTEEKLVEKMIEGDAAAFNEAYLLMRDSIYSFVYRMLGSSAAAEDVTQETFVFLIEYPEKYLQERGSLQAFLCGVARNRIMHYLRSRKNKWESSIDEDDNFVEPKDTNYRDPLVLLLEQEFILKVEESLALLPPLQREVIILRELQEFSYEEIAKISGENINTIKVRLHRARAALAGLLAPYVKTERKSCHVM